MTITTTSTAAAARPRNLSTPASPSVVFAGLVSWHPVAPSVAVPTFMRTKSAFRPVRLDHNSIVSTIDVALVPAGNGVYRAAKQAAPPRGIPR